MRGSNEKRMGAGPKGKKGKSYHKRGKIHLSRVNKRISSLLAARPCWLGIYQGEPGGGKDDRNKQYIPLWLVTGCVTLGRPADQPHPDGGERRGGALRRRRGQEAVEQYWWRRQRLEHSKYFMFKKTCTFVYSKYNMKKDIPDILLNIWKKQWCGSRDIKWRK